MKKALAILMTIALVSAAAFADVATTITAAPTVTAGVTGEAEAGILSGNTISVAKDGVKTADTTNVVKSEPNGLQATKLVSNDWVNLDWSKMSIKAEGKFDAYGKGDDLSLIKVTTTWKDFFGFNIKHEFNQDDKGKAAPTPNGTKLTANPKNEVTATLDKTKDNGVKFWTTYNANTVFGLLNFNSTGTNLEKIFNGFTNIGFEFDNTEFYGKLVMKNDNTAATQIDTAIVEGRKLFGLWTVRLNDSAETKLRIARIESDSKINRPEYVIGNGFKIQETNAAKAFMNINNTIAPEAIKGLTVNVFAIAPSNTSVTVADWLRGSSAGNLTVAGKYAIDNVGTIGAGTTIQMDYDVTGQLPAAMGGDMIKGKSRYFTLTPMAKRVAADATATPPVAESEYKPASYTLNVNAVNQPVDSKHWGTAFWLDARLDKLLGEGKDVMVAFDIQTGEGYAKNDMQKEMDSKYDNAGLNTGIINLKTIDLLKGNLYAETKMKLMDPLTISAATLISFGTGYSYAAMDAAEDIGITSATAVSSKAAGRKYVSLSDYTSYLKKVDDPTTAYVEGKNAWVGSSYTEANIAADYYGISPFTLKFRGDYKVNDTVAAVFLANSFTLKSGKIDKNGLMTEAKDMYGFYDKDVITVGTKLVPTPKSTLTLSADINIFLGLPTAGDITKAQADTTMATAAGAPAATVTANARKYDVYKANLAAVRDITFGSGDFSPFGVKIAYKYSY